MPLLQRLFLSCDMNRLAIRLDRLSRWVDRAILADVTHRRTVNMFGPLAKRGMVIYVFMHRWDVLSMRKPARHWLWPHVDDLSLFSQNARSLDLIELLAVRLNRIKYFGHPILFVWKLAELVHLELTLTLLLSLLPYRHNFRIQFFGCFSAEKHQVTVWIAWTSTD